MSAGIPIIIQFSWTSIFVLYLSTCIRVFTPRNKTFCCRRLSGLKSSLSKVLLLLKQYEVRIQNESSVDSGNFKLSLGKLQKKILRSKKSPYMALLHINSWIFFYSKQSQTCGCVSVWQGAVRESRDLFAKDKNRARLLSFVLFFLPPLLIVLGWISKNCLSS